MIYLLIPIYNEEENIPELYVELSQALPGEEKFFIFSDDGSTDDSVRLLKQYFSDFSHVILGDGVNRGPGAAFNNGFEWILEHSVNPKDIIVTLEADCTSDLELLEKMVAINRLGYDLVLSSVYAQGGGFEKTSFIRKVISTVANLLFRFLFDIKILTLSSFYRTYSISIIRKIKEKDVVIIAEKGFICMLEVLVKALNVKASCIEVPMKLRSQKRKGKSKMKLVKTTLEYMAFFYSKRRNGNGQPLK